MNSSMTSLGHQAETYTNPNGPHRFLARIGKLYTDVAVTVLSTLIFSSMFLLLAYGYYGRPGKEDWHIYSKDFRPKALHRMDTDQALTFFKEFDRLGQDETYIYQPWVGFSERVFHATRLNVDDTTPLPTRRTIQHGSSGSGRSLVVWTFGGSTMFGWGVPDDETIASHLSTILSRNLPGRSVTVSNHGHSYFYSSQELMLFQMLLRRGDHCDVAVFLDGLNDSMTYSLQDVPAFTDRMRVAMTREQQRNPAAETYFWISPDFPPVRLLRGMGRRLARVPDPANRTPEFPPVDVTPDVNTYKFNLRAEIALANVYGIKTLFFWQPVPPLNAPAHDLAAKIRPTITANNFHYIGDIFQDMDPGDVYVDYHHYGDIASERIAQNIAQEVVKVLPRE
jgi:hypothetical protein